MIRAPIRSATAQRAPSPDAQWQAAGPPAHRPWLLPVLGAGGVVAFLAIVGVLLVTSRLSALAEQVEQARTHGGVLEDRVEKNEVEVGSLQASQAAQATQQAQQDPCASSMAQLRELETLV